MTKQHKLKVVRTPYVLMCCVVSTVGDLYSSYKKEKKLCIEYLIHVVSVHYSVSWRLFMLFNICQ